MLLFFKLLTQRFNFLNISEKLKKRISVFEWREPYEQ